jgi:hypothetical protein
MGAYKARVSCPVPACSIVWALLGIPCLALCCACSKPAAATDIEQHDRLLCTQCSSASWHSGGQAQPELGSALGTLFAISRRVELVARRSLLTSFHRAVCSMWRSSGSASRGETPVTVQPHVVRLSWPD